MTLVVDSSALVTRYASEPVAPELGRPADVVVLALARVEVPSAIWRKQRMGELPAGDASVLVAAFEAEFDGTGDEDGFQVVAVSAGLLDRAARLLAVHALRAYDAVQLATALTVTEVVPECSAFAVLDHRLREAAAAEGLALVP